MTAVNVNFRMRYRSTADLPCLISVFEVEATGDLQNFLGGNASLDDDPRKYLKRYLKSQRPALEEAKKMSPDTVDRATLNLQYKNGSVKTKPPSYCPVPDKVTDCGVTTPLRS